MGGVMKQQSVVLAQVFQVEVMVPKMGGGGTVVVVQAVEPVVVVILPVVYLFCKKASVQ